MMQKPSTNKGVFTPISDEQLYANPLLYLLLVPYQQIYRSNGSQPDHQYAPLSKDEEKGGKEDE